MIEKSATIAVPMPRYLIPNTPPLILRDRAEEPAFPGVESEHDITEIQDLIKAILGSNSPALKAVKDYGSNLFRILYTEKDIRDVLGVGEEEARKLLAAIHFGRKLFTPAIGTFPYVRGIQDIDLLYRAMAHLPEEQLRVLLVNNRYQIVHEQVIHSSATDLLQVSPVAVLHPAVKRDIRTIILVHNHPSGISQPSAEDITFSYQVQQAAALMHITLLDHVIIALDGAASALPATNLTEEG